MKFFGDKGRNFIFVEAEVKGFHDELLQSRADLTAAGLQFEGGRLMRDIGSDAPFGFDKTFFFQILVNFGDCQEIDVEFRREFADRRELHPVEKLAGKDALLKLLLELQVKRHAAVGIEQEHSVVVY